MSLRFVPPAFLPIAASALCFLAVPVTRALTVSVAPTGNIQAAIDQVAAAGGGIVDITSGTGTISTPLRMKSKVTLNGAGNPATTLNAGADITVITQDAEGLNLVTVQNLKINGRGRTGSVNCAGLIIQSLGTHHRSVTINNVQILNCGGMGSHMKRCDNSSVTNCNYHDSGNDLLHHNLYIRECSSTNVSGTQLNNSPFGSGFHIAGVTTGGSIKNSTCSTNGQNGMNIQDNPSNYTIDTCTANGNRNATPGRSDGIGIAVWGGTGVVKNCTATANATLNYKISGFTQSNNH